MPKKEPVSVTQTRTWLEISLPDYNLAVRYGEKVFFEAAPTRYGTSVRATEKSPTTATELTAFTLTDEAMAKLQETLAKHLKTKGRKSRNQRTTEPALPADADKPRR